MWCQQYSQGGSNHGSIAKMLMHVVLMYHLFSITLTLLRTVFGLLECDRFNTITFLFLRRVLCHDSLLPINVPRLPELCASLSLVPGLLPKLLKYLICRLGSTTIC